MNKKIKKIIFVVIVLVIGFFLAVLIIKKDTKQISEISPTPSPQPFSFIRSYPQEGKVSLPIENLALQFTFSQPINLSTVTVNVTPNIDLDFSINKTGTVLSIYPTNKWSYQTTYKLTINAVSIYEQTLTSPVEYSFTPIFFTDSQMDE